MAAERLFSVQSMPPYPLMLHLLLILNLGEYTVKRNLNLVP